MARLHEYQGKTLLREHGMLVPTGRVVRSADEARAAAAAIDGRLVLKAQVWVTSRKALGGVVFTRTPGDGDEAAALTEQLLALRFGRFPVTEVLIEEAIDIAHELFVSLSVDDTARAPVLLLDARGGSGIEDRAERVVRLPVSVTRGIDAGALGEALASSAIEPGHHDALVDAIARLVEVGRNIEARSLEINPLVVTTDGQIVAVDCRIAIDDYAVFRHPELGIEIARELDHPATPLEQAAYAIEAADHRGTFYFAELPVEDAAAGRGVVGFHGAGGGGSMMSMDAVSNAGFTVANFCDTSGNPSAAKVYRAARIILAQRGLVGYFGSGSGVASQEQFHSAYGLAKAFLEMGLTIPAVVRLGGNGEDRAVEILGEACRGLPAPVEGYRKDDTPAFCADRFATLVGAANAPAGPMTRRVPAFVGSPDAQKIEINGGRVWIDTPNLTPDAIESITRNTGGLFRGGQDSVEPTASAEEIAGKDSELIAGEIECGRAGHPVLFVDLAVPLLDDACEGTAA